ncbi:hypothetical protein D9M68_855050 [compost metagenome]
MSWTAPPPADLQALVDALDFESTQDEDEEEAWDEVWEGGEAHWEYAGGGDEDGDEDEDDERDA